MKITIGIILFALSGIIWFSNNSSNLKMRNMEASVNFKDGKFINLEETPVMNPDISFFSVLRQYMKKGVNQEPGKTLQTKVFDKAAFLESKKGITSVWLGHSTVLLNIDGVIILTDPFFGERASPVSFAGTKKFEYSNDITIEDLPNIDIVLISHDHYDHLHKNSIKQLQSKATQFIVPLGVAAILKDWDVSKDKIVELDWWANTKKASGVEIIMTPARHFSGRTLKRNTTLWCSYVIKVNEHKVYFSGDSGYGKHFKQIGDQYGPFDLTLMECGQYNDSWSLIHMNPSETYQANLDLKGKKMIPLHWGKFKLSLHPWTEPVELLIESSNGDASGILTPEIGAVTTIDENVVSEYWWR